MSAGFLGSFRGEQDAGLITQLPRNWAGPAANSSAVDRLASLRTLVKYSTRSSAPQQSHRADSVREPQEEKPNLRAQQHLATVEKTLKQKSGWEIGGFQFLLIPTVEGEAAATPCRFLYDFSYWLVPAEWEKRFPQSSFGLASFPGTHSWAVGQTTGFVKG